jgi:hypothetical protein
VIPQDLVRDREVHLAVEGEDDPSVARRILGLARERAQRVDGEPTLDLAPRHLAAHVVP